MAGEKPCCKNHPEEPAVIRRDGISRGLCQKCLTENTTKARKSRGTKKPPGPKENGLIHLDFSPYADLLQRLQQMAKEEFRPLEMEILYLLQVQAAEAPQT